MSVKMDDNNRVSSLEEALFSYPHTKCPVAA